MFSKQSNWGQAGLVLGFRHQRRKGSLWQYGVLNPSGSCGVSVHTALWAGGPRGVPVQVPLPYFPWNHTLLTRVGRKVFLQPLKGGQSQEANMKGGCGLAFCLIVRRGFDFCRILIKELFLLSDTLQRWILRDHSLQRLLRY